jgi:subtilisin family serine protease
MGLATAARLLALGCAALTGSALAAPINLPPLHLPPLPGAGLNGPLGQTLSGAENVGSSALTSLRRTSAQALIRHNRQLIEADPNGEPMLRGQLVALDLRAAELERVTAQGFVRVGGEPLGGAGSLSSVVVLHAPPGISTRRALRDLRGLVPEAVFDYDHLYSGSASDAAATTPMQTPAQVPDGGSQYNNSVRVGLIDAGVEVSHRVFRAGSITVSGCNGQALPSSHGTAVASLLVGDAAPFRGAAPGAQLYAVDVYCAQPTGGAVDAIAAAFSWLQANEVAVINISLVGPDNLILRQVVKQLIARGHILVAAVGNDGPAAPPLYPAAYPDVVGVTAVDAHRRALIEAGRGAQVEFAAPGADMVAANYPDGFSVVRGTSFAAPLVAGLLAARLAVPDAVAAHAAIDSLAREAIHLSGSGRDTTYGLGLVAERLRVPADIMQPPLRNK